MEQVYKKDGTLINLLQDVDVETGDNYIKFSNGTLICWGYPYQVTDVNIKWGSLYYCYLKDVVQFPIPFIDYPVVNLTCQNAGVICATLSSDGYTKSGINQVMITSAEPQSDYGFNLHYIAIGRWK